MDFIINETEVEDDQFKLVFSDDDEEDLCETIEDRMFIEVSQQEEHESRNFYRDLNNRENYVRFHNQTRNPVEVAEEPEEDYYGKDNIPEMYDPENKEEVNFDLFAMDADKAKCFKDSLVCFSDVENHFFYGVIYGLMHDKLNGQNIELDKASETLGENFVSN